MIRLIIALLVLALIFAVLGFGGIAEGIAEIAEVIFYIFLVILGVAVVVHLVRGSRV